jgi:hypothetical protein
MMARLFNVFFSRPSVIPQLNWDGFAGAYSSESLISAVMGVFLALLLLWPITRIFFAVGSYTRVFRLWIPWWVSLFICDSSLWILVFFRGRSIFAITVGGAYSINGVSAMWASIVAVVLALCYWLATLAAMPRESCYAAPLKYKLLRWLGRL